MEKNLIFISLFILFLISACKQEIPTHSQIEIKPLKPKVNEQISIFFKPGKDSPLVKSDSVTLQALSIPVNPTSREILEKAVMREIAMSRHGMVWEAKLTPPPSTGCIVFQFKSDGKFENNNNKGWNILIYGKDKKPIEGAYSALSQATGDGMVSYLMNLKKFNSDTALMYYKKEIQLYPDNWRAKAVSVNLRYSKFLKENNKNGINELNSEMLQYVKEHPNDIHLLEIAYVYFYRTAPQKSLEILRQIEKQNPKHRYVLGKKLNSIKKIQNINEQIEKLLSLQNEVKGSDSYYTWAKYLLEDFSKLKKWDKVIELGNEMLQQIETSPLIYPSYPKNKMEFKKQIRLYLPLKLMAVAYHRKGENTEAEKCYRKLNKLNLYPHQKVAYLEDYIEFLIDLNRLNEAENIALDAIKKANANKKIEDLYKKAYVMDKGDEQDAIRIINKALKESGIYRKKELTKKMIKNPQIAPEFTLTDLDGNTISSKNLRGKTVILDFWATWCSPCKASFPYLQKFWEKHKNDKNIALFAVNTKEQLKDKKRVLAIKKFMKKNGYDFPVLLDNSNNTVMKLFEIGSIPTKIFIGPNWKIYFKDIGFHGPSMVEDMDIQLELIKEKSRSLF